MDKDFELCGMRAVAAEHGREACELQTDAEGRVATLSRQKKREDPRGRRGKLEEFLERVERVYEVERDGLEY